QAQENFTEPALRLNWIAIQFNALVNEWGNRVFKNDDVINGAGMVVASEANPLMSEDFLRQGLGRFISESLHLGSLPTHESSLFAKCPDAERYQQAIKRLMDGLRLKRRERIRRQAGSTGSIHYSFMTHEGEAPRRRALSDWNWESGVSPISIWLITADSKYFR